MVPHMKNNDGEVHTMRKLKLWLTGLILAMSVTVSACGSTEARTESTAAETTVGITEVQAEETRLEEVETLGGLDD